MRFCIRSVSPEERRALEAVGVRPHDCIGACTDCFHRPVLARGDQRVPDQEVENILRRARDAKSSPRA
ncbi:MAG: hypothetical protein RIB60_06210 [Phycisphaerales bacterium]